MADAYTESPEWPWPGDSREDKAKRIANSYRTLCLQATQGQIPDLAGALHRLDQRWLNLGIYWHLPDRAPVEPDDWVDTRTAAHYADRSEATIRVWAHRDLIDTRTGPDGAPEYRVGSLRDYGISQWKRRARKHSQ